MRARLAVGIPCFVTEPSLDVTLESLLAACCSPRLDGVCIEIVLCINGSASPGECVPLAAVRRVCARRDVPVREVGVGEGRRREPLARLSVTVLCTARSGKAVAWNVIRRWVASDAIVFCDADVLVDVEAITRLYETLQANPELQLITSAEIPLLTPRDGWIRRAAALPYKFDLRTVSGKLHIMRSQAVGSMPEGLLFDDAWLTLTVGKPRIVRERAARVFFLPPATARDWLAERVRTEAGKLQLKRSYPQLFVDGPTAEYPWRMFFKNIALREYPLALLLLTMRAFARVRAHAALRAGTEGCLWRPVHSSKQWARPTQQR